MNRRAFLHASVLTAAGLYVAPDLLAEPRRRIFPVDIDLRTRELTCDSLEVLVQQIDHWPAERDYCALTEILSAEVRFVDGLATRTIPITDHGVVCDYRHGERPRWTVEDPDRPGCRLVLVASEAVIRVAHTNEFPYIAPPDAT